MVSADDGLGREVPVAALGPYTGTHRDKGTPRLVGTAAVTGCSVSSGQSPGGGDAREDLDLSNHRSALDKCRELLGGAISSLAGDDGAVFAAGTRGDLQALVTRHGLGPRLAGMLEEAALSSVRASRAVVGTLAKATPALGDAGLGHYFAAPLSVGNGFVGALVVAGLPSPPPRAAECLSRLGMSLDIAALYVERTRMLTALDRRGDEVNALRRQLESFAVDFRSTYQAERDRSAQLVEALGKLEGTYAQLEQTYRATVQALAMAVEAKDEQTGGHLQRVTRYGMMVTELVAPEHARDPQFEFGFLLHDLGKLSVPDEVLRKPGPLDESEWELVRQHPASGRSVLDGISFLAAATEIVFCHHERWDGQGYPRGLRGMEIPLGARIFPLCDAFDAMTSDRPYRKAMTTGAAIREIQQAAGRQFWPDAVDAFLSLPRDTLESVVMSERGRPA